MEIAVISGKGGTGKSIMSAAFATQAQRVVLADCDVDAANLHLIFNPDWEEAVAYAGGKKAVIYGQACRNCGYCIDYCRFDAISMENGRVNISEIRCDGCQLCIRICPYSAISLVTNDKSRLYSGTFRNGMMVSGHLAPGEENSGKLVNLVRERARELARLHDIDAVIIDGPPGIGCPAISTVAGVDHAVIVTEPTISGIHDLKRTIEMCSAFRLKVWVIINKYDLNNGISDQIEALCNGLGIALAGKFPFNPQVVEAMVQCKSIMEWAPESGFASGITTAFKRIIDGER